jgi:hypothetical protein
MTNQAHNRKSLFRLQEVSSQGNGVYSIKLTRDGQVIATKCSISSVATTGIGPTDLLQFDSDEFNELSMSGDIYLKPIGKVIFAFHACLQDEGDLT